MRYHQNTGKRESSCREVTHPNSKRKLSVSIWTKDAPAKALLRNTAYPKPVFLHGAVNSAKNAKLKPSQTQEIYHVHNGVDGYRSMKVYLERKGYFYSAVTVHKYMNTELGLRSIVRPKKPEYEHGKPHKVFDNKLNQNFYADEINRKWCTDFTYLFLANHEVRYNCTIILRPRSAIYVQSMYRIL